MTRLLLAWATLATVVLLPVRAMSADIVVQVRDLKGKPIAQADIDDNLNSRIQIKVTRFDRGGKIVSTDYVAVPDRDSTKISFPDDGSISSATLEISDLSGGRKPATVNPASNTAQTIVVALPENEADKATPAATPVYYYAVCPPVVVRCVPSRSVARHGWFRHR